MEIKKEFSKRSRITDFTLESIKDLYLSGELSLLNVQCIISQNINLQIEIDKFSKTLSCVDCTKTMQVFYHFINGIISPPLNDHGKFMGFMDFSYHNDIPSTSYCDLSTVIDIDGNVDKFLSPHASGLKSFLSKTHGIDVVRRNTSFLDGLTDDDYVRLKYIDNCITHPLFCLTCGELIVNPETNKKFCCQINTTKRKTSISKCESYYIDFSKSIYGQYDKINCSDILNYNISLKNLVIDFCLNINGFDINNASNQCMLWHWRNNKKELNRCIKCNAPIPPSKFQNYLKKYPECCSYRCSQRYVPNLSKRLVNNSPNCLGYNTNVGTNEKKLIDEFSQKIGFKFESGKHIDQYFPDGLYKNIVLEINEKCHTHPSRIDHDIKKYDHLISKGYKLIIIWEKLNRSKWHVPQFYKDRYGDKMLQYTIPDYLVSTDDGWCLFDDVIYNGERDDIVEINKSLRCTKDHNVFTNEGKKEAIQCDGLITKTGDGDDNLMSVVIDFGKLEKVYDLFNVRNSKHSFFVNNEEFLVSNCIIDEAAFVKPSTMEELWASVYPVISRSATSKFVMVSTPNGIGGKFHEIWEDSTIAHNPEWTPVFIPWYKVPGRDEAWKKKEIAGFGPGGIVKFNAEYECQFLGSSPTLLDSIALRELIDCAEEARVEQPEPAEIWKIKGKGDETFDVSVWKKPKPGRAYILGGDVGEGVGLDSSVAKIFDITDLRNIEEVASYESNTIPGPIFGYIMMKMARRYNQAYVACERNGVSTSAIDALWRVYEYENIVDIGSNKAAVGIFSNWATKLDACLWLKDLMKDSEFNLILHDSKAVLEFQKFERVKAKSIVRYEASSGHDDRVMATIWAIYITKLELIEDYYEVTSRTKNCFGVEIAVRCRPDCPTGEYFETEDQLNRSLDVSERIADLKFIGNSNNANNPNAQKALPNSEGEQNEDFYDFVVNDARESEEEW